MGRQTKPKPIHDIKNIKHYEERLRNFTLNILMHNLKVYN